MKRRSSPKIAAFWLGIYAFVWLLQRSPDSAASELAFSWQGPYPIDGELKSTYYRKKTLFAIGWLVQLLTVAALVSLVIYALPKSESAETFALVCGFALMMGVGMAILGAILAALVSLKAWTLGPNPAWISPLPAQQFDVEDEP